MQHQRSDASGHKQLQLWYCADCQGVHLRTDHVSLTFNNNEFAQLSKAVLEIYQDNMGHDMTELQEEAVKKPETDDILESDLIV